MRVLIVSTSERSGGGAIAANRLMDALNHNGVKAKMLVRDKQTDNISVAQAGNIIPKALERLSVLLHNGLKRKTMWQVDLGNTGIDITSTEEYREADVIHLHWINQGMLSLNTIRKIVRSGKKVVWTLHDEWPLLGVCHYRGDCTEAECRHCPLMQGSTPNRIYKKKRAIYNEGNITFVGCSQWITNQALKALPGQHIVHINNCIPHEQFHPIAQADARLKLHLPADKRLVLFCCDKVTDERKGMHYLLEALKHLQDENIHLIVVGKGAETLQLPANIGTTLMGRIDSTRMPLLYAAANVFVTPSLQDNLPNTIAEAMSMGTPCVGFHVGGIPEMIDHQQNGYVAQYRDAADLAQGIRFVLTHEMREAAAHKAANAFGETHVAQQYIKIYES